MACQSTGTWEAAPAIISACAIKLTVICFASFVGLPSSLVMKDLMEVGPLSREVMSPFGSTSVRSMTQRLSLFPSSLTRNPINSPFGLPSLNSGEITGLPRSAYLSSDGLGAVFPPVGLRLRQRISKSLNLPTYLLVQACQRLWLVSNYDVY
jgi:hypothetical protein